MKKIFQSQTKVFILSLLILISIFVLASINLEYAVIISIIILIHIVFLFVNFILSIVSFIKGASSNNDISPLNSISRIVLSFVFLAVFSSFYTAIFAGILVVLLPLLG